MIPLHLQILGCNAEFNRPGVKYFLVKFAQKFPPETMASAKVKELVSALGVTDKVVKIATEELLKKGWIEKTESNTSPRMLSSPRMVYKFKEGKIAELMGAGSDNSPLSLSPLIEDLLLPDSAKSSSASDSGESGDQEQSMKRHALNISQRQLLAILLLHADKNGTVTGISKARLCKLAVMKPERLRTQLKALQDKKYLRGIHSGGTGRRLYGKIESVYYLGVCHPSYQRPLFTERTIILGPTTAPLGNQDDDFNRLQHHMKSATCPKERVISVDQMASYLEIEVAPGRNSLLQSKLDQYSSFLLSNHFNEMDHRCEGLQQRIRAEAIDGLSWIDKKRAITEKAADQIVLTLGYLAVQQALAIKNSIDLEVKRWSEPSSKEKVIRIEFLRDRKVTTDGTLYIHFSGTSTGA